MGFVPPQNLIQLLLRNPDGSVGLIPEAGAVTFNLSTEQKAILQSIADAVGGSGGAAEITFGTASVAYNSQTIVVSYTVPLAKKLNIRLARGWGDIDGEFALYIDAVQIDGARTTPAELTASIFVGASPLAMAGQVVTLKVTHFKAGGSRTFKGVIQGLLENI